MNEKKSIETVPRYVRLARGLALLSSLTAAGCASTVVPANDGASSDTAINDAVSLDGTGSCPTTQPAVGTACTPGCTYGMQGSCGFCSCPAPPATPSWTCQFCGGPAMPPDLPIG